MKAKQRVKVGLVGFGLASVSVFFLFFLSFSFSSARAEEPVAPAAYIFPSLPPSPLSLPIDEPELSMHGSRTTFYASRGRRMHQGLDLKAKVGMALYAAEAGELHSYWMGGKRRISGGYTVAVITPQWVMRYLHMDPIKSEARIKAMREAAFIGGNQPGDPFWMDAEGRLFVSRGVIIGYSGKSGGVRPHLHFQVNPLEGPSINPLRFFTKAYITGINNRAFLYSPQSLYTLGERQLKVKVRVENQITNYGPMEVRLFLDAGPAYLWQVVNFNGASSQEATFEMELPDDKPHVLSASVVDNQYTIKYAKSKAGYLRSWWNDSNQAEQQVAYARAEVCFAGMMEVKGPVAPVKEAQAEGKKVQ